MFTKWCCCHSLIFCLQTFFSSYLLKVLNCWSCKSAQQNTWQRHMNLCSRCGVADTFLVCSLFSFWLSVLLLDSCGFWKDLIYQIKIAENPYYSHTVATCFVNCSWPLLQIHSFVGHGWCHFSNPGPFVDVDNLM